MKQVFLATLVTAITATSTPALAQFKDCQKTRLGCLQETVPLIPIDQPVVIQVGLQVNIKCEALAENGKNYFVDLHLVKKVEVTENQNLDYYLVPGNHGLLNFEIKEVAAPEIQQYVMGEYVFHSEIEAVPSGPLIKANDHRATRVGNINTNTELAFSPSGKGLSLKIISAQQVVTQNSFFMEEARTSTKKLTFTESNCVYY